MNKETKRRSIREFEAIIDLPDTSYFVKNESSIRFCYIMHGRYEYINLATPLEIAQFLKKHGMIKSYAVIGQRVEMYKASLITTVGPKGQPVLHESITKVDVAALSFTRSEVVHFAAVNEWNKTMKQMAPVVRMFTPIVRRVA
jgi:hypothetical protein